MMEERYHMLEIKNLSFDVTDDKGQKQIIQNLNLSVDEGKFVVITGPNGSGKSTLAKLIAGIEKPSGGQIFFDGKDITGCSITDRANLGISFALQQPVRFKGITVLDLLRLAAKKRLSVGEGRSSIELARSRSHAHGAGTLPERDRRKLRKRRIAGEHAPRSPYTNRNPQNQQITASRARPGAVIFRMRRPNRAARSRITPSYAGTCPV